MSILSKGKKEDPFPSIENVQGEDHGEHWYALLDERDPLEFVQGNLSSGMGVFSRIGWKGMNVEHGKVMENDMIGLITKGGQVRMVAVIMNGSFWTAVPVSPAHTQYDVAVGRSRVWKNGIEGWLEIDLFGASLTGFDPLFFIHRGKIQRTSRLGLIGLAYSAAKGQDRELSDGKHRITQDSDWILPLKMVKKRPDGTDFSPDTYSVRMKVDSREEIDIFGDKGFLFRGSLLGGKVKDFPIIVRADHVEGEAPEPGTSLSCSIWLQTSAVNCTINGKDLRKA